MIVEIQTKGYEIKEYNSILQMWEIVAYSDSLSEAKEFVDQRLQAMRIERLQTGIVSYKNARAEEVA